jgi:two-component system, NtrC family, sensor kinase
MIRKLGRRFHSLPLRRKLILSFLAVICAAGIISLVLGTRLEHRTIISLAETKVRHDLASAWMVYNETLSSLRDIVRLSTAREFIKDFFLQQHDDAATVKKLEDIRREFHLDILTLTDASGRVVLRARQPQAKGDDQSGDPLVARALRKQVAAGTQIIPRAELLKEGNDLAERAYFEFVPTLMAAARAEDHEQDGMMLRAAAPVSNDRGQLLGVLYGGLLVNRNYAIVDQVKDIVYKGEKYKDKDIGTATIFQRDLRIATNVLDDRGSRAVGTRVSQEVNLAVLLEGRTYVGRAFVVAHWYITAYAPIKDVGDRIIGMLYVGILEKPYIDLRNKVMVTFAIMAGSTTIFLLALLGFIAANITRPLRVLVEATSMVAKGDLDHRVEIDHGDELGQLATAFNSMTDDLRQANENLTQWGLMLEKRVEERTQELQEAEENLVRSEKLASLGKIAAGVAHEINNPLTSILIYTHLMLERCSPEAESFEPLTLIAEETSRCAQIVKGLLEFARQRPAQSALMDINLIVDRTVQLLEKQALVRNIRIVKNLDSRLPEVALDKDKIQQVFSNLLINACEAMPGGGTLTVTSRLDSGGSEAKIIFADTGIGIPKENVHKLFDPFFTTKSIGTGLGLAVSYGIIRQRGGTIDVKSEVGKGSVFTVRFPIDETANEKGSEKAIDD